MNFYKDKNHIKSASSKILLGLIGTVLVVVSILAYDSGSFLEQRGSYYAMGAAAPFVYFLIGILELVLGVPFSELGDKWDDLKGWQQVLLGAVVIVLAIFAALLGMVAFG